MPNWLLAKDDAPIGKDFSSMGRIMAKKLGNNTGAAAVEFAVMAFLFFIVVFGIIDFGWYFFCQHTIKLANHKGAIVGKTTGDDKSVIAEIKDSASIAVDPGKLYITITGDPIPPVRPDIRVVTTQYTHKFFTPMIGAFFSGGDITIEAKDTYKLEPPWLY